MRPVFVVGIVAMVVAAAACGGSSYSESPAAPSTPIAPASSAATTIAIVGQNGAQSFSPNPVVVGTNGRVAWQNNDGVAHRIVFNDNSFDSGTIAPGAASAALSAPAGGTNYHCSIHPTMIGAMSDFGGEIPECTGPYC